MTTPGIKDRMGGVGHMFAFCCGIALVVDVILCCLFVVLFVCLFVCFLVCLFVCLFACLLVCLILLLSSFVLFCPFVFVACSLLLVCFVSLLRLFLSWLGLVTARSDE